MTEQPAAFRLRRATADDSRAVFDVFLPSIRDLADRLNTPWQVEPEAQWQRMRYLFDHLAAHAAEWWIAEDAVTATAIGYARSVERGGLFELSEFFVHPGRQQTGVGAALLEHAFPRDRGEVRTIIATPDVRAQARYYRAGTAAMFPIVALEGRPRAGERMIIEAVRLEPQSRALDAVRAIERDVLEFDRGGEHDWLAERREGYLYRRDGRPIGFAYVGREGCGPIATLEATDQAVVLAHVESRAAALGISEVTFETPMVNAEAVRHLLDRGYRMDAFYTFLMASRPFGRFDRYIGFSPPFVL
jgi:GNAT superfamily N-acetyltransferase